jgi:hypothetical protein
MKNLVKGALRLAMRSFHKLFAVWILLPAATFVQPSVAESCPAEQHPTFRVTVAPELAGAALSGRLIVMMSNQPGSADKLAPSFGPDAHSVGVAAQRSPRSDTTDARRP